MAMIPLTDLEKTVFEYATICHICENPFKIDETKVRDHCHLTGKFRGAAHKNCNLEYQDSKTIRVVFIYISFTKNIKGSDMSLRFIDSFRFMASSLDKL